MRRHAKASAAGSSLDPESVHAAPLHPRRLALFCLAITTALALTAPPALALKTHPLIGSFGPEGPSGSTTFANVQGVAVDQTSGNVYVYDTGEGGKIYKFDAAGEPVDFSSTGTNTIEGVGGAGSGENELAVAPAGSPGGTAGNIYAAKTSAVLAFSSSGAQVGELTGGETCGVATDPAGHVFVGAFPSTIREYTPTANAPFAADLTATSTASYPGSCNIAVDGLGNAYAAKFEGTVITKLAGIEDETGTSIEPGARTLAVDPASNDLYADRGDVIAQYDSAANLISSSGSGLLSESRGIAVKGGGDIYAGNGTTVEVFGSNAVVLPDVEAEAASEVKRTTATFNGTISAAGGPNTSNCEFQYASEEDFNSKGFNGAPSVPCEPAGPFSGTVVQAVKAQISGLGAQTAYRFRLVGANENGANQSAALSFETARAVNLKTGNASNLTPTSATLNATINPEGLELEECNFIFLGSSVEILPCAESPVQIGDGEGPVPVHVNVSGLDPNTEYVFLITARNELGESEGDVESFETYGPPLISGEFAADITTSTATLTARVNPRGLATSYAFEYVSEADFLVDEYAKATVVPVPEATIDPGTEAVEVAQSLSGLLAQSTYHFRLVATNAAGAPVQGQDAHFTTFFSADSDLPDDRVYELVSPSQKGGEVVPPEPASQLGGSCGDCLPGQNSPVMPMQSAPDGESVLYLGQPFSAGLASNPNDYLASRSGAGWDTQGLSSATTTGIYEGFSADLSRGVIFQEDPALSPQAPTRDGRSFPNLYLRQGGELQPLLTTEPPNRSPGFFRIRFATANAGTAAAPGFTHLLFEANDALTAAVPGLAPAAPEVPVNGPNACTGGSVRCNLYEWVGGQLRLINVLPGNTAAGASAVIGAGRLLNRNQSPDVDHAISADGSRIFWSSEETGQIYVRIDGKETLEGFGPGSCKESFAQEERVCFLTASADGSKVLLSDGQVYELNEAGSAYEPTYDLTLDQSEVHRGGFAGTLGAAEDLSRVYFVDTQPLSEAGVENANGEHAEAGEPNLYGWQEGDLAFIGILAPGDRASGTSELGYGDWTPSPSHRTAQVSPDGRYLAFMSLAPLTGFDNTKSGEGFCGSNNGSACREVFEYSAESGALVCASCNPTDRRPLGPSNLSLVKPGGGQGTPFRQPANLSPEGGGRLFFESQDVLSPRDTNGQIQDVYEWEPNGVGSCRRADGCVHLISSGHSPNDSFFLDATPTGGDAFFITREQLLPRDKNDQLDLYDARVGGGIEELLAPPCLGQACRGPGTAAPAPQSLGSSTFAGPVNQKPKHKKNRKHHKRKRHHKRSANHSHGAQK